MKKRARKSKKYCILELWGGEWMFAYGPYDTKKQAENHLASLRRTCGDDMYCLAVETIERIPG